MEQDEDDELEAALKRVMEDTTVSPDTRQLAAAVLRRLADPDNQGIVEEMDRLALMLFTAAQGTVH